MGLQVMVESFWILGRVALSPEAQSGIYCGQIHPHAVLGRELQGYFRASQGIMPARCVFHKTLYAGGESEVTMAVESTSCAMDFVSPRSLFRSALHSATAFLAPARCRLCRVHPLADGRLVPLCDGCMAAVESFRLGVCCHHCAEPLGYEPSYREFSEGILCSECRLTPPAFVRATAFGSYELMRHALRLFKFGNVRSLARPMGAMLAEAVLTQAEGMPESLLVIPVPLFRRRRLYNQSHLLAHAAMRVVRRHQPHWKMELAPQRMKRVHHKESQYRLSPEERRENVRGAFRVRGSVRGRHVLLVDDVYTTGATVTECTEVLLAAGAESVRVVTLARAGSQIPVLWTAPMDSTEYPSPNRFGTSIYPHPVQ